jgi:alpha-glucosidase (family GH31 glycosyl hydrolase)
MKKILLLFLLPFYCLAQNADRKYVSSVWKNNILEIKTSDGTYRIKPYSDKIIETTFLPDSEKFNPVSHAVVMQTNNSAFKFSETSTVLDLKSNGIAIRIQKVPFKISYFNKNNEILSEKTGYSKKESTEILSFNIDATEKLYGGGARVLGMDRRGNRLQLYNRAHYGYETSAALMNFCIPLVLSSKIYAVHFDNPAIGYLDLDSKKDNTLTYETISGRKTYQVIVGDSWTDLISGYTSLTGKQPLIPRWALGNFSSRFGYRSQEEVEKTIRKFEEDKIPVDAIILDLYWFGKTIKGTMGNLEWDKDNFPNPDKMVADLNQKGIKTILITEPFILTTSSKWQEAVNKKVLATDTSGNPFEYEFYFGHTGIIDIFKPEGKDWFWKVYKRLIDQGVGGVWGDLGEPEVFPSAAVTFGGKADEIHNSYGHNWARLVAEGYKKDFPNVRPFILMRAGYSGSQRFGMIPWSGDVSRSWGGLQAQTEIALQMGMQGMAYMHSDLGGFAGDYFDNELYIRWLQYGVFQPIFRPHAQEDIASEPVYKDIVTKAKAKKQVELRYKMLPYNYTLAFENSLNGTPLMRPLFFEELENEKLATVSDSYLWGNHFLVKPITKPNITSTTVYFPKRNNWFDFYTDKKYTAGSTSNINVTEDHIPVFVRGGAFIPMIHTIQNTSQYSLDTFDLHFYFDAAVKSSNGHLYNDDGVTPNNYENKKYEKLTFRSKANSTTIALKIDHDKENRDVANTKKINLIVHGLSKKPMKINVNGKPVAASDWAFSNQLVTVTVTIDAQQEIEIIL